MEKSEYLGEKPMSRMQCKLYDINLNEGFIVIKLKAQENKTKLKEREAHVHSHTIVHVYVHTNAVLW